MDPSTNKCCHNLNEICCGTECCDWTIGEVCCGGDECCNAPGCDSSDCEQCVNGTCEPCLEKASTYEELTGCSGEVVADPDWTPQPNGCSNPLGGDNPAMECCGLDSSFKPACDAHDTCYQTCNSIKLECECEFSNDLHAICEPFSGTCKSKCEEFADIYVGAVTLSGQPAWEADQVLACTCCVCE